MHNSGKAKQGLGAAKQGLGPPKQGPGAAKQSAGEAKRSLGEAKYRLGAAKEGQGAAKQSLGEAKHRIWTTIVALCRERLQKHSTKGWTEVCSDPCRRERIAFMAKFGDAGLGRRNAGLGRIKAAHFRGQMQKRGEATTCLDCTGASGSRFLRKTAKCGLGAVKQGRAQQTSGF